MPARRRQPLPDLRTRHFELRSEFIWRRSFLRWPAFRYPFSSPYPNRRRPPPLPGPLPLIRERELISHSFSCFELVNLGYAEAPDVKASGSSCKNRGMFLLRSCIVLLLLFAFAISTPTVRAHSDPVTIGFLAFRPAPQAEAQWAPLATYLEQESGRPFTLRVLNYRDLEAAVADNSVDLVLTNPAHYILLRERKALSGPMVTLVRREGAMGIDRFGGVIFTRTNLPEVQSLADVVGRKIAAVDSGSLGGYQVQIYEMFDRGLPLPRPEQVLLTEMPHDRVVDAVLSGAADVGFVRTGVLESMAAEGILDLAQLRILEPREEPGFRQILSTRLYPEWPILALPHLDQGIHRAVNIALLQLTPDHPVAQQLGIHGFSSPYDYGQVEVLARALRLPPFDRIPEYTLADLWQQHGAWIIATATLLLILLIAGVVLFLQYRRARCSEQRFFLIFEDAPEPAWILQNNRIIACNREAATVLGYTDRNAILEHHPDEFAPPEQPDGSASASKFATILEAALNGIPQRFEWTWVTVQGNAITVSLSIRPTTLGKKKVALCIWHDITQRKEAEEKLRLAASVFSHARDGIMITDAVGSIIDVNETFEKITGYARAEVLGKRPSILKSGRHSEAFYAQMWRNLLLQGQWQGEVWNRRKDGTLYPEILNIAAVRNEQGKVSHHVALFTDITHFKDAHQQQLQYLANYDSLTGLPNRALLTERLQQALARCTRSQHHCAVVMIDLDGFKRVNDSFDHVVGDELLVHVARGMAKALRVIDTLARIGGDEFAAIIVDLTKPEDCEPVLARLLEAAAQPIRVVNQAIKVSASMGVTFFPQDHSDADQLLRHADQAMYVAKQNGRNRYSIFDLAHDRAAKSRQQNLESIRTALRDNQFLLYYQPKVNMRTGTIVGVEALLRWQHPEHGLLAPAAFLPTIENEPVSVALGEWVIDTALQQAATWRQQGLPLAVSINVCSRQLQQDDFTERMQSLIQNYPSLKGNDIDLEILETSALSNLSRVSEIIHACKEFGLQFALDDFGTGYSSLTYLKQLPATTLKIDRSFVQHMINDSDDLAIVEGVIGLASAFSRHVIAEGVESLEHGEFLLILGCDLAQGYGIAQPMPAAAIQGWMAAWQPDPSWQAWANVQPTPEDVALVHAEVQHRQWVRDVERYLNGTHRYLPSLDALHCSFAKWQNGQGQRVFGADPDFVQLHKIHQDLHLLGHALVKDSNRGVHPRNDRNVAELHLLHQQLIHHLHRLHSTQRSLSAVA